ncbi:DUF262 domain-containing protein [Proteus mirabilis]|uniref:DUF262 domain-containing protein n=1 Tax=Proteus mirabilis TaxID=584 RepID=UPI0034D790F3
MHRLDKQLITVADLLVIPELRIPEYQRPYKWTQKNLNALLADLRRYKGKSAYRLGTVVFHHHYDVQKGIPTETLDIVDGQQRTLTLLLLVKAILVERELGTIKLLRTDVTQKLNLLTTQIDAFIERQTFNSDISHHNLYQNFLAARRAVSCSSFSEEDVYFLLNKCQLVSFVLNDISEAFQFFDSQNARGRDLDPHDLLKAFHLREFSEAESGLKAKTVSHWENLDSATLKNTFANYLYPIRQWVEGHSAQYFNKNKVGVFKGVNLDHIGTYPYTELLRIAHYFVDDYNNQYQRRIDHQKMLFPFHLDQIVINGRRFFEMVSYYQKLIKQVIDNEHYRNDDQLIKIKGIVLDKQASRIIYTLNTYPSRHRIGDKYIRNLFDCALIFYIDKFGMQDISAAIEKLFVWAYRCRLQMQVVQLATMDNYARKNNIFKLIKNAIHPVDVLNLPLETIKQINGTKLDTIVGLFKELKYYE